MREVLRTTDPVKLSFAIHVLSSEGIEYFVADQFMSILEGSIGAIPRRLMVAERDEVRAGYLLRQEKLSSDGAKGAT